LSVPKEHGGHGLPLLDCIAAHLELAQGSASTAMVAGMNMQVFGNASEQRCWPESIFEQMCRASVRDGAMFNTVASEPQLGSPSRGAMFATRAQQAGESWIINGHKTWSTGGRHLTHLLVKLTLDDKPGLILVPNHAEGIAWIDTWGDGLSLRASESNDVTFTNVIAPDANVIERELRRDEPPNPWFPMIVSAVYLGAALAARNAVIRFALDRVPTALGKPIATLPKIQRQIGEIDLALQAALMMVLDACRAWTGRDPRADFVRIVAAKTLATETAAQVTQKALHIAGGSSLTRDLPLERYFRDSQPGFTHPPSGDTAYEIIGQHAIDQWQRIQNNP
jgi:alkylation response protein AidB-like acyl-CoA dehydrogenase